MARTRWEPNSACVIVMTRWTEDDLAGCILAEDPGEWEVLSLPALAEENDALGRKPGEPLWAARFPLEELERTKRNVGSHAWAALYQQRPAPAEGALFQRSHMLYWTPLSDGYALHRADGSTRVVGASQGWKLQTVDLAVSTKTSADFTVVGTFLVTPNNDLLVLDVARQRLEGPDVITFIEAQFRRMQPDVVSVETVQYQLSVWQQLVRNGLPVRKAEIKGDKFARAVGFATRMEAGTVYFPRGAAWMHDVEEELFSFPHGAHDDQVDGFSMAAHEVIRHGEQNWDVASGVRRCECGVSWSDMAHQACPGCGKPPEVSEQPDLKVVDGTAESQESWYPEPSKPDPMEQLAAIRAWAGQRW